MEDRGGVGPTDVAVAGDGSAPALGRTLLEGGGLGLLGTLAVFWRVLLPGQTLAERDLFRVYLPTRQYWAERVAAGGFPDWFPYDSLGQSFPGALITGAFHPSNLLYLLADLPTALELNLALSYGLAFTGMYAWLRRGHGLGRVAAAAGAVTFGASGYLVSIHNNLLYLMATATLPWLMWAVIAYLRRPGPGRLLLAAGTLASVLFCGDPQAFVVDSALVVGYALLFGPGGRWRDLPRAVSILAAGAGLAAIQLFPVLALRADLFAKAQLPGTATQWSTIPPRALDFFLGPVFSPNNSEPIPRRLAAALGPDHESWWVYSLHLGAAAMILLGFAVWRRRREWRVQVLLLLCLLLFTLMLGRHAGLYELAHSYVPFWNAFRYPEKLGSALTFLLAFGIAFAARDLLGEREGRRRSGWILLGGAGGLLALGLLELATGIGVDLLLAFGYLGSTKDPALLLHLGGRLSSALLTASGLTAVTGATLLLLTRRGPLAGGLVVASFGLTLVLSGQETYRTVEAAYLLEAPASVHLLRRRPDGPRPAGFRVFCPLDLFRWRQVELGDANGLMASSSSCMPSATSALWGIESAESYLPGASGVAGSILKQGRAFFLQYSGLFSVRFAVVDAHWYAEREGRRDRVLFDNAAFDQLVLYNEKALPRAFLAPLRCLPSLDAVKLALSDGWRQAEAGEIAFAECPEELSLPPATATGKRDLKIREYAPERIVLEVESPVATGLILNDAHYPGWTATVDGEPAPIYRTNQLVRGLRLPAGRHRVAFRYRSPGLLIGGALSAATALGLAGWALLGLLRRRREVPSPVTSE